MLTPKFLGVITLKYKDHEVVLTFDDGPPAPWWTTRIVVESQDFPATVHQAMHSEVAG